MLPWQKSKANGGSAIIMKTRTPDTTPSEEDEKGSSDEGLTACMEEMHSAHQAGDHAGAAKAFRNAYKIVSGEPQDDDSNDFDSQNEKATAEGNE